MSRVLIIPAGGIGSRLGLDLPKALAPVNGRPMLEHVLQLYRSHVERAACVVRPGMEREVTALGQAVGVEVCCDVQAAPTGMLDAILIPLERVRRAAPEWVWITWCDQVGILPETVGALAGACPIGTEIGMVFPTVESADPYIHFDRDESGRIVGLRQRREGDVMPATGESDAGLFGLSRRTYVELLPQFAAAAPRGAGTGERNFLPFVPWLSARHPRAVSTFRCRDPREAIGINTPEDLRRIEAWLRERDARSPRETCA